MMNDIYIIDASGYIYRSYFAIRNITNHQGESTNALFGFIRSVSKLIIDFQPYHLVAVFDGPRSINARTSIYADYKAHRPDMPPDLLYQIQWAREYCALRGIPILNIPEVEADDTMGSIAVWASQQQQAKAYICTSDKDMCQLVNDQVFILNTFKDNLIMGAQEIEAVYGVPPHKIIDFLAITGDASDNIPGLSGFGPKTASALLQQFGSLEYILAHPEEIPGKKKQETLIQEAEKALLSKQLVTVNTHVSIPREESFYRLIPCQKEQLKSFYISKNFNSLLKELEKEIPSSNPLGLSASDEQVAYQCVDDEESLNALVGELMLQKEICFDTETTSIHALKAELIGIGLCYQPSQAWYVPVNGQLGLEKVVQTLKPLFENSSIGFYGHNVKYDLHVLSLYGIQVANIAFDTILASYLLNSHRRQHSLDTLSLEYFGKVKISIDSLIGKGKKAITMREVPLEQVMAYCCEDVDFTCRLKKVLKKQLQERKLYSLLNNVELPLLKVLLEMERQGIYLDKEFLKNFSIKVTAQIRVLEKEIYLMAGEEFNLNSPKQMSDILFNKLGIQPPKKTATGNSTSAEVLEFLQHQYPIASKLMEYRMLEKLRSTYVETLPLEVNPKTHRIHCTFNQSVAATGRLSCQDPNLQNIPVRTEWGIQIRQAFRPEKSGWSFLAADYSQIELRLLAHLSEDPTLLEAFQSNQDIHLRTAAAIFNVPLEQVTKEMRYQAKTVNFGVIYGQGPFGLSQTLGIDVKDAKLFIEMYFKQYSKVKEYLESVKESVRKLGKAVTLTGRERLIPEINSKNMQIRAAAERLAVNAPIQGTAADLIKLAMIQINERLHKERKLGYMVIQIHDELIFELPDFEILSIEPMVREIMQNVFKLKVPLIVDISIGKNWKEC
ncbi:DNA polymerase I [Neochlamydia sp. EPS4]|uniref:DNA polymerase I n=1 Tax=Neochlamydia sp. EPS4 TaxID=1478175 RepID=UPI00058271EF|nr:DNA polymerase I [Neochlamydia sp. EPS4]KIC75248.1 DNA polymerase I [Neochlamydia sp. EPS4]